MYIYQVHILMSLAVAEAIVQRRKVSWIRYSTGAPVHHIKEGT